MRGTLLEGGSVSNRDNALAIRKPMVRKKNYRIDETGYGDRLIRRGIKTIKKNGRTSTTRAFTGRNWLVGDRSEKTLIPLAWRPGREGGVWPAFLCCARQVKDCWKVLRGGGERV